MTARKTFLGLLTGIEKISNGKSAVEDDTDVSGLYGYGMFPAGCKKRKKMIGILAQINCSP